MSSDGLGEKIRYAREILLPYESPEEKAEKKLSLFREEFRRIANEYELSAGSFSPPWLEVQRVAYLGGNLVAKIYGGGLGMDAAAAFAEWASLKRVRCPRKIERCEFVHRRRLVANYPAIYHKVHEGLYFGRFLKIAESIILPQRIPFTSRSPVISLHGPKKSALPS